MKNRAFKLISILFLLNLLFIFYLFLHYKYGFFIPCIFSTITGLECPGCGITRMVLSLLKLDFYQAFRYNPLVFIYTPFLILYVIYKVYLYIVNKKDEFFIKIPRIYIYIVLVITVLYGILRNIEMFSFLKPTSL